MSTKNDKVLFAFVDAQEERSVRHAYGAKCDYECGVRVEPAPRRVLHGPRAMDDCAS